MIQILIEGATTYLIPFMVGIFTVALVLRSLTYYMVRRQLWFTQEFEKRIRRYLATHSEDKNLSFFSTIKYVLQQTYYEIFKIRERYGRRKHDAISSLNDRVFLIQDGCGNAILDTLNEARYLKASSKPDFIQITKDVFSKNHSFGHICGVLSVSMVNRFLSILPALFIVGGIFGTFLGIIKGLPTLSVMDITNASQSKAIMDSFLNQMAFAMNTSIVGIILSVFMSIINSIFSPDSLFVGSINRFAGNLTTVWNKSGHNLISGKDQDFLIARDRLDWKPEDVLDPQRSYNIDQMVLSLSEKVESFDIEKEAVS